MFVSSSSSLGSTRARARVVGLVLLAFVVCGCGASHPAPTPADATCADACEQVPAACSQYDSCMSQCATAQQDCANEYSTPQFQQQLACLATASYSCVQIDAGVVPESNDCGGTSYYGLLPFTCAE